jgi:hypothetical protein
VVENGEVMAARKRHLKEMRECEVDPTDYHAAPDRNKCLL